MERNARLMLVSSFVILSVLALVFFYQWIQGPDSERMRQEHAIQFTGSVSGLSIGSAVRYLGVPVGRVTAIALSREFPGRVNVMFGSDENLPAPDQLMALLEAQGITGLSIIELRARSADNIDMEVEAGAIPGYPSLLSQLSGSATRITQDVEATLGRINALFNDQTVEDLGASFRALRVLTENLSSATEDIDVIMSSTGRVSSELEQALPDIRSAAEKLNNDVLPAVTDASRSLQAATDSMTASIGANGEQLTQLIAKELPTLVGMSDDLAAALQQLNSTLANINNEPGALLYGEQPREVEISRD